MTPSAPQSQASGSHPRPANPQLGPEPWFTYPTPTPEQIEDELPPYFEEENVNLGVMLGRLARKGYGDMRVLVEQTLPPLYARQKPRHIIEYAKTTRQAVLKYLAILRWKSSVDIPSSSSSTQALTHPFPAAESFPTPHSNGESNSPGAFVGKGKGRAMDEPVPVVRGKVTDAKRITHFMEHQNRQHEDAVAHVRHAADMIESLRERNPDLLTALSLLTLGTYNRLPTSLTESFLSRTPLTNGGILATLRRLDQHILYRLRCVDYLPPEFAIEGIRNGRVYLRSGGFQGWKAQMTVVGFDEDARWWLTGVEWVWRIQETGVGGPGGQGLGRLFGGEERQQILDLANGEVLPRRQVESSGQRAVSKVAGKAAEQSHHLVNGAGIPVEKVGSAEVATEEERKKVDAPLVRIYNFLQHLSLSYQLEVLYNQAIALSQGKWRGQLLIEMDRAKKVLQVKYWIRPRPAQVLHQPQAAVGKRQAQQSSLGAPRKPIVGGTISIFLAEKSSSDGGGVEDVLREIISSVLMPSERVVRLDLSTRWEIGAAGIGGGLKVGDAIDSVLLPLDPNSLSLEGMLVTATNAHASHSTRARTASLVGAPRVALFAFNPPNLVEADTISTRTLALRIPLPSHHLLVGVSSLTGLIEIEDDGSPERAARAKLATTAVNEQKSRLVDDVGKLITAVITENLEGQMRQLGWTPARRLNLRSRDLARHDLHPASTVFVPLPTSLLHYFVAKIYARGIGFELLKLARIPAESGVGIKLVVGNRSPLDLERLRVRRGKREQKAKEPVTLDLGADQMHGSSSFEIDTRDLKDLFIFCNALVAQTIVEQQLKDRAIPYTLQYPPTSGPGAPLSESAVAGMVPTLCVQARDLLKDTRAADVAMPRVYMQIWDWWKAGKCQVVTLVQLRHKPTLASTGTSPASATGPPSSAARAEGITFDQASSIVRFQAGDISRCVPSFLEQWERLSKVVVVAGEVNRLNKTDAFRDIKVLSFDLRTATFSYSPGYVASITYTPEVDSYEVSFSCDEEGKANPHDFLAALSSHRLNELAADRGTGRSRGTVGVKFIGLLRNTLPVLLEVEAIRAAATSDFPKLVVRSVSQYRLVWDVQSKHRYAVDLDVLPSDQYLLYDASRPRPDGTIDLSCGRVTRLDSFPASLQVAYQAVRLNQSGLCKNGLPPVMKLDGGTSLVCSVGVIGEVVRCLVGEIGGALGMGGMGGVKH